MGIYALSLVVGFDIWAPLGLEVVHVECSITWHFMDESRLNVFVRVCERAELLVVADVALVSAEFGLVLFDVVKSFHPIMGSHARVLLFALFGIGKLA